MNESRIILDSACFIQVWSLPEFLKGRELFTTGLVFGEMRSPEALQRFSEISPKVMNPKADSVKRAREIKKRVGDSRLSDADLSVLALALELNCPVATDDYSLQNACKEGGIDALPVVFPGIRQKRKFSPGSGNLGRMGRPKDK